MNETVLATSTDGVSVLGYDEGRGRAIVILGPGLDDGRRTKKLARILSARFRVIRIHRRQYRLDLKTDPVVGSPCSVAQEVADVEPVVLYGHSVGGVVALESLAAASALFAGAVVFEPATPIEGLPLSDTTGELVRKARAELAAGRPGRAMASFVTVASDWPKWKTSLAAAMTACVPRYRRLVPAQIDSLETLETLGVRLDTYAQIKVPTVLLAGGSPRNAAHIRQRVDAVHRVMPQAQVVVMDNRDHAADVRAPKEVARVIESLAERV